MLLAKDYTAKLADMGLFGQSPDKQGHMIRSDFMAHVGTVEYTAPEARHLCLCMHVCVRMCVHVRLEGGRVDYGGPHYKFVLARASVAGVVREARWQKKQNDTNGGLEDTGRGREGRGREGLPTRTCEGHARCCDSYCLCCR